MRLAAQGWRVVISARRQQQLQTLADAHPGLIPLALDVADANAIKLVAAEIAASHGPLELLICNAGDYRSMPATSMDAAFMQRLMTVNYFGAVHMIDAVLPSMLERGHGHIAINASVAGYRGLPLAGAYGPTKAALINLAESLRAELPDELKIQIFNPGFVETPLTAQNEFKMPGLMSMAVAADRFVNGLASAQFEVTFPRRFTWLMKLMRCLPYVLYFPLVSRITASQDVSSSTTKSHSDD